MTDNELSNMAGTDIFDSLREAIARNIARRVSGNSDYQSSIPSLTLFCRNRPMPPTLCLVETSIILAVQGEKQMLVGGNCYPYNARRFLVTSLDIPATSQVVDASVEKPCLGLGLKLDLRIMAELMAQGGLHLSAPRGDDEGGIGLGNVTSTLLEPFRRLVELLDTPESIPVLAPLIEREIHYRLLCSEQGARLWQSASLGSKGYRIARAIEWLRENYRQTLRVEELAGRVQMSTSSLYQHFRQFTAMSPLQYQKWLRLSEARRLMLSESINAANAAFQVGYESPSQFSREYTTLFGAPPKRDVERLRQQFGFLPVPSSESDALWIE